MDVGGTDQESSLFQAFIVPSVGIENKNVNKTNDPIKQSNLSDQEAPKPGSHKDDQPQLSEAKFERFKQLSTLPLGLSKYVAKDLIGTPLEDIDPFYKDKQTFIIVNRNKDLFRFSVPKSLWLFRPNNVLRRTSARISTDPLWTAFMILVVLVNCFISLLITGSNKLLDIPWELIFVCIYIFEFILKVLARGFVLEKFTYLRDPWNCFDLLIIIHAISAICVNPEKAIYSCPSLCELRVLKLCSLSLSLRRTVNVYLESLLKMRDLLLYITFAIIVISIMCLEMYMGILSQHCVQTPLVVTSDYFWSTFTTNSVHFLYEGGVYPACGNSSGAQDCPTNYVCLQGNNLNPNYGITSFDTFLRSFLVVLRLIQRDFWEETMQYVTATAGEWHILLFIALIYYISFQLCALLWTPIALAYNYLKDEQWENDLLNDLNEAQEQSKASENKAKNPGCCAKFQRIIFNIIYNPFAVLFIIGCILLNTLFMALDHHNMPRNLENVLSVGNYVFVLVFVIEAILKLTALGPAQYFRDEWNTFDFIVTALGVIELGVENVQGLSVLRAFRLLRPLRLGKIVPAFDLLMKRVRHLFSVLRNQTIILCIFIYIFVVFGCRTFAKNYNVHELPRWNLTDIFHSFMVVFRSLCGEWVESLYDCNMLVLDASSFVYFCALALIGSFSIMHIFVALILTNDDSSVLSSMSNNIVPNSIPESHAKQSTIKSSSSSSPSSLSSNRKFNLHIFLKEKLLEPNIQKIYDANKPIKNDMESLPVDAPSTTITLSSNEPDDKNHSQTKDSKKQSVGRADVKETGASSVVVSAPVVTTEDDNEDDATINKWSKFRVKALKFNQSTYFGYIVLAIIFIGSIALVHTVNSLTLAGTLLVELAFCIVMIIEFISKTISCGWKSYFKNIWCLIDLFNTIVPIVGLFAVNQTILILNALRPLSLVSRCSGLKIIAVTIARQARLLFSSILICSAFWLIFAIMGVQMFAGKFYQCVDRNQTRLGIDFVDSRNTCIDKHYEWTNSAVNFDNVIEAYLSLLQVATFKGWIRVIQDAVDSREVDSQPLRDANLYMFLYFVIFIVFGVFICANLIIGILIKHILNVGNLSDAFGSSKKLSTDRLSQNGSNNGERAHDVSTASKLAMLARNQYFDCVAFAICLFYIISLAFDQYQISEKYANTIQYIDLVCAVLFMIETAMRLNSLRRIFLLSFWNFYDSVTVILLLIELFMIEFGRVSVLSVSLLRVIRVLRFNSLLVTYSPALNLSLKALRRSVTAAYNLCLFQLLVIFVYTLIGVVAFKNVPNVILINDKISFKTAGRAIILLIQISTTAGWDGIYDVLVADNHFNPFVIFLYLWSFLFICILTIVNLVLTIVLNYYSEAHQIETESKQLHSNDLMDFNEKWNTLASPSQPIFINKAQLPILLNRLDTSSALRASVIPNEENIQLLGIPVQNDDQLYRGDVLIALNKNRLRQMQATVKK